MLLVQVEDTDGTTNPAELFLLRALLEEQQSLSAVDRFARDFQAEPPPAGTRRYVELLPASPPGPGEQYAFEVDLDACTGCKACVTACHNLNGLDEGELWRGVGLMVGGTAAQPVLQHITTACHHCLDPACMAGCPVLAYEKDPDTGIVYHLDDQCIGCQYCILKCPYDVPRFNRAKGIVRKCDLCRHRLAVNEPPVCAQACPNQAIRIRVVEEKAVLEDCEANQFLPGAPQPGYTVPTTIYSSAKGLPRNMLPADYYTARPAQGHIPLVFMLVLTQMSVGAFALDQSMQTYSPETYLSTAARPVHLVLALMLGLLGLVGSLFHLGRPRLAYRALLGLRRSWLSREIAAFGVFAGAAAVYVAFSWFVHRPGASETWASLVLGRGASLAGVAGVFCSVMIYVDTRRPEWGFVRTAAKFFLGTASLGIPVVLLTALGSQWILSDGADATGPSSHARFWAQVLILVTAAKLLHEISIFAALRQRQLTPAKRAAQLLRGELGHAMLMRLFCGLLGGVLLPLGIVSSTWLSREPGPHPAFLVALAVTMFLLLSAGEVLERYLFFATSMAPKMPGGPAP